MSSALERLNGERDNVGMHGEYIRAESEAVVVQIRWMVVECQ